MSMDLFHDAADWLAKNPWLNLIGLLIGIVGCSLAIILYFRSKKVKEPLYSLWSINIIQGLVGRFEGVRITYAQSEIATLTVTKVAIWNGGRDTIDRNDIASADPLIIRIKNGEILNSNVLCKTNEANQFAVKAGSAKSEIELEFDYLDRNDGAVIQIMHTGASSKDVEFTGTVKSAGTPILRKARTDLSPGEIFEPRRSAKEVRISVVKNVLFGILGSFAAALAMVVLMVPLILAFEIVSGSLLSWVPVLLRVAMGFIVVFCSYGCLLYFFKNQVPARLNAVFRQKL